MLRRVTRACWVLLGLFITASLACGFAGDHYMDRDMMASLLESDAYRQNTDATSISIEESEATKELSEKEIFYLTLTVWFFSASVALLLLIVALKSGNWIVSKIRTRTVLP